MIMQFFRWLISVDHPMRFVVFLIVAILGLGILASHSDNKRCAQLMALATTKRDSLDAAIACEQIKSATATSIAIGAGAGAVAGAAASRR